MSDTGMHHHRDDYEPWLFADEAGLIAKIREFLLEWSDHCDDPDSDDWAAYCDWRMAVDQASLRELHDLYEEGQGPWFDGVMHWGTTNVQAHAQ